MLHFLGKVKIFDMVLIFGLVSIVWNFLEHITRPKTLEMDMKRTPEENNKEKIVK